MNYSMTSTFRCTIKKTVLQMIKMSNNLNLNTTMMSNNLNSNPTHYNNKMEVIMDKIMNKPLQLKIKNQL